MSVLQFPSGDPRELGPGQAAVSYQAAGGAPAPGLPTIGSLTYLKTLIELAFLLLAIPWVLRELRHGRGSRAGAKMHADATHLRP